MTTQAAPTTSPTAPYVPAPDAILTAEQVAQWLQIKPRQVQRLGIPCKRLGHKTLRYRATDVLKWLEKKRP